MLDLIVPLVVSHIADCPVLSSSLIITNKFFNLFKQILSIGFTAVSTAAIRFNIFT